MTVSELVGVYDADGRLCDITHSAVRRKGAWDRMVARLPVPVRLLHLDAVEAAARRRLDQEATA